MNSLPEILARNMKARRNALDWTQEKLAEITDLSLATIQLIETKKRWPEIGNVRKIADALGVSEAELFQSNTIPEVKRGSPDLAAIFMGLQKQIQELKSMIQPRTASLADALRSALNDAEFKDIALAIKNVTGGRVQLELPHQKDKSGH